MAARESAAVERAVAEALTAPSQSEVARRHGIAVSTLRRAMRRHGQPPRTVPSGEAHHERRKAAAQEASCAAE
jgi:transposase-like protein